MTNIVTLPTRPNHLGRYEILAEIGRGSIGVVYKARDPIIDRVVAIKIVNAGAVARDAERFDERFFREARSVGKLNHPNIVTIYDAGKAGAVPYIAMELLDGPSLRELLDAGYRPSITRIVSIALQAARGLAYAHDHGIVHRDVKPANLILVRNSHVKLTDFGIARGQSTDATMDGEVVGSPIYMSPEQIRGERVDGRTDVFALGSLLYELLTEGAPFEAESFSTIMSRVLEHTPEPPSRINPEVPPELDAIVLRMLVKNSAERYPDEHELEHELRTLLRRLPEAADMDEHVAPRIPVTPAAILPLAAPSAANDGEAVLRDPLPGLRGAAASSPRSTGVGVASVAAVVFVLLIAGAALTLRPQRPEPLGGVVAGPRVAPAQSISTPTPTDQVTHAPAEKVAETAASPRSFIAATAPSPAVPPVATKAVLAVAVAPWGDVYVDGAVKGTASPRLRLTLEPGRHRIVIRNGPFPPHLVDVAANAGEVRALNLRFE